MIQFNWTQLNYNTPTRVERLYFEYCKTLKSKSLFKIYCCSNIDEKLRNKLRNNEHNEQISKQITK